MVFLGFQAKEFTLEEFESTQQGGGVILFEEGVFWVKLQWRKQKSFNHFVYFSLLWPSTW